MLAKNLGWSQRQIVTEMGADEIVNWMAYELTQNPEWLKKINKTPITFNSAEEEADAMRKMLMGLCK